MSVLRTADALVGRRLAAESDRLLRDLAPALEGLLELTPVADARRSLLESTPLLTLALFPVEHASRPQRRFYGVYEFERPTRADRPVPQHLTDARLPEALRAFAAIVRHSWKLNGHPELKCAFWLDVLRSRMPRGTVCNTHAGLFEDAVFPRFAVDCSDCGDVSEVLVEALRAFLATPSAAPATDPRHPRQSSAQSPESRSARVTPIGLLFARCQPTTAASLETIESLLDDVCSLSDRQFAVDTLDLSDNDVGADGLEVVTRLVDKCQCVYQVRELRLDRIVPAERDNSLHQMMPSRLLGIARAVFEADMLSPLASGVPPAARFDTSATASRLRRVSMKDNMRAHTYSERLLFFEAHFSALRYGCPVEEDATEYGVWRCTAPEVRADYWRWMAFGLFYPRPKRFEKAFKLRSIGRLECTPGAAATFAKTLRNPVSELFFNGAVDAAASELMVCMVKQGAEIQVIQSSATSSGSTKIDTVAERSELEALWEKPDGSVCVVVPGVGLAWVKREFVERIEREPLDSSRSEQDGWFDIELSDVDEPRWAPGGDEGGPRSMIECVGRQFRSLIVDIRSRQLSNSCGALRESVAPERVAKVLLRV